MVSVRRIGLRVAAFWLGALVAAAYFPLVVLVQAIDGRLWPVAIIVELALLVAVVAFIRLSNISFAWSFLGLPVGLVISAFATFIILLSIYGWSSD